VAALVMTSRLAWKRALQRTLTRASVCAVIHVHPPQQLPHQLQFHLHQDVLEVLWLRASLGAPLMLTFSNPVWMIVSHAVLELRALGAMMATVSQLALADVPVTSMLSVLTAAKISFQVLMCSCEVPL